MAASSLMHSLRLSSKVTFSALRSGSQPCHFSTTWRTTSEPAPHGGDNEHASAGQSKKAYRKKQTGFDRNDNDGSRDKSFGNNSSTSNIQASDDPNLYRIFFRSPDKIRALEEAQVFINHIKLNYGPLTQYQFSRCPETKRYFGYGFLTFKNKESLDKALKDHYVRVGSRDFELKRSGRMPLRWTVVHRNTGFQGFYNLEELRLKRAMGMKEAAQEAGITDEMATVDDSASSKRSEEFPQSEPFISAFASTPEHSSTPAAALTSTSSLISLSSAESPPLPSKPVRLHLKGMAQLWKTIPDGISRTEQVSKSSEEAEEENEATKTTQDSQEIAAQIAENLLHKA
ncbi:hypothetical protein BG011_008446 [Mortierella polycephala]|uniref:RRM domain-containing protein n=1 Tax=Mortierella polycephala TaxID=41804 RepID=A0A9P6QI58_9FUNG|nr:hypothetical protein BG011_008446 [Mortierella polycephala]